MQALIASLHESGVEPTIVLQQCSGSAGPSPCVNMADDCDWGCSITTGAALLHAVCAPGCQSGVGESLLGLTLSANQVACIAGG